MTKCDICNNKEIKEIKFEYFIILMCPKCYFGRLKNLPDSKEASKIYKSEYFQGKNKEGHIEDSLKKFSFVKKYINNDSKILDFGCGTGNFLIAANTGNYELLGYDISESAKKTAEEKTKLKILSGSITANSFKSNSLDCIVCFDVIEHLPDYREKLLLFNRWLKKGGYLFISTPNTRSWDALVMGKSWYGFRKYPEHVVYFSPKSITTVLNENGFEVKRVGLWGFIRSFNFILENGIRNKCIKRFAINIIKYLNLSNINLYIPMTDMIVVAIKKPEVTKI